MSKVDTPGMWSLPAFLGPSRPGAATPLSWRSMRQTFKGLGLKLPCPLFRTAHRALAAHSLWRWEVTKLNVSALTRLRARCGERLRG